MEYFFSAVKVVSSKPSVGSYQESRYLSFCYQCAQMSSYLHQISHFYQTHYHQITKNVRIQQIPYHIQNI